MHYYYVHLKGSTRQNCYVIKFKLLSTVIRDLKNIVSIPTYIMKLYGQFVQEY